jgi:hypothetical protein
MATFVVGTGSAVTSWAGNNNQYLVGDPVAAYGFTVSVTADAFDSTPLGSTVVTQDLGLYSWTAQIVARYSPAAIGNLAGITYATGYVANAQGYTLNLAWAPNDVTPFGTAAGKVFAPGLLKWGGSYECLYDDTTVGVMPVTGASGSATFTLVTEASEDHELEGDIHTVGIANAAQVGQSATHNVTFEGNGDLTATGDDGSNTTWTNSLFKYWEDNASGVVGIAATGSLVLTAASGVTWTGDAFPSAIQIVQRIGQPLTVNITAQGTGALTPA